MTKETFEQLVDIYCEYSFKKEYGDHIAREIKYSVKRRGLNDWIRSSECGPHAMAYEQVRETIKHYIIMNTELEKDDDSEETDADKQCLYWLQHIASHVVVSDNPEALKILVKELRTVADIALMRIFQGQSSVIDELDDRINKLMDGLHPDVKF